MNDDKNLHPAVNGFGLPYIPATTSICSSLALSVLYVASLYVWSKKHDRDHPITVKQRFLSVIVVMFIAPVFVYKFSAPELLARVPFLQLLGLRWDGLLTALVVPMLLTMLLFLGPLCMRMQNGQMNLFLDANFVADCFKNVIWLRNHIVAPLTEEFVYRACMMPLILQSFTPMMAVLVTPLFFGTAHIHHISERLLLGHELKSAITISCFQFSYTTLFGFYSSYLFARTGHIVAPFLVHSFCNHIGLPDFQELWQQDWMRRAIFICCFIVGFVGWLLLLPIATEPALYANTIFWNV